MLELDLALPDSRTSCDLHTTRWQVNGTCIHVKARGPSHSTSLTPRLLHHAGARSAADARSLTGWCNVTHCPGRSQLSRIYHYAPSAADARQARTRWCSAAPWPRRVRMSLAGQAAGPPGAVGYPPSAIGPFAEAPHGRQAAPIRQRQALPVDLLRLADLLGLHADPSCHYNSGLATGRGALRLLVAWPDTGVHAPCQHDIPNHSYPAWCLRRRDHTRAPARAVCINKQSTKARLGVADHAAHSDAVTDHAHGGHGVVEEQHRDGGCHNALGVAQHLHRPSALASASAAADNVCSEAALLCRIADACCTPAAPKPIWHRIFHPIQAKTAPDFVSHANVQDCHHTRASGEASP